jgi:tRNA 2-thiouridine synthesizing protein A
VLTVEATDPAAPEDFRAFCETTGHMLVSMREIAGVYCIEIRRSTPD